MSQTFASDRPAAIVTGASRGIGRAIAEALGQLGFGVAVNYSSNEQAARQTVELVEKGPGKALAVQANVAEASDRQRLVEAALREFGRIDVLVNNAGITSPGRRDLLEATEENWDRVFAVNLKGPFFLAQQVAREMIRLIDAEQVPQGTIINVSSISALAVSTNRADYCITKAAMGMMTELFATRLAEHGIQVFEICPGVIETDMTGPVKAKYDRLLQEGLAPIRRWGKPSDVGRAVAALVSGYFPYTTGQRFYIDGGLHIRRL